MATWNFDKFMKDIVKREQKPALEPKPEKTPQRRYIELYREKWQNRVRWQR